MDIILSSRNPGKVGQIKQLLAGLPFTVLSLSDAGIKGEADEDGLTLADNAMKKALFAWRKGWWAMADDTGIFIDALGGQPGVYSARWAGEGKTTAEITAYTLGKLKDVPLGKRTATFKTVAVLIEPDGATHKFMGEAPGTVLIEPRCPPPPKMPYSGIFAPDGGGGKVWAEMSLEEENALSHRGKAFSQVRQFLEEVLKTPA